MLGTLSAIGVHLLTASGVMAGYAALMEAIAGRWEAAFAWLAVAAAIDGVDGPLARYVDVKRRLPRFSGERLDLIIDYFTYVIVPGFMIAASGKMPGGLAWLAAAIVLLTSLFHFCDTESKTEDGFFVGFPAVWNVVALYLFIFPLPPYLAFALVALLGALTFVPLKWVHPIRVRRWRMLTVAMLAAWALAAAAAIWEGFPASRAVQAILAVTAAYFVLRGLVRSSETAESAP